MSNRSRLSALSSADGVQRARSLRSSSTDVEQKLWYLLRARRFEGFKFRRQVPLGNYVVDFLCDEARLIVEVDGGQHAERIEEDALRTRSLEASGYRVIRFWNSDVIENLEGVLDTLSANLVTLSPALSQGRGRKT